MDEKDEVNKDQKPVEKKERRSFSVFFKETIGEYKGEFKKIIWPTRQELVKKSLTVIVVSLMFGAIIAAMDFTLQPSYNLFVSLFAK